jgi:indolepyruvate ferredoxin oxidoreductase alpha subunit
LKKLITGNEAVAYGALRAGVKCVTGYPGTPSTGALASLLERPLSDTYVEWSTNEKVAFEIATGAAWAGHRALCTMKMSGVNVAADSLLAVAYSGTEGGLVIYVADDPGVSAGCVEEDSRLYAAMADLPVLEPTSVTEAYTLTAFAFELSEAVKAPVFLRLVTPLAHSFALVELEEPAPISQAEPLLIKDISRFTKAGAQICMTQHRNAIRRLDAAEGFIRKHGLYRLELATEPGGLGIIASGVVSAYLEEAFAIATGHGVQRERLSVLRLSASHPFPADEVRQLLAHCSDILVLEELEPHLEKSIYVEAQRVAFHGRIVGKLDGTLSRIGEYGVIQVLTGLAAGLMRDIPTDSVRGMTSGEELAAARPITTCAGCPHRGTFMAINAAIKKLHLKPNQVMVTGDIGCTILGMNPPFDTVWTEVSMGASISLAQGYVHAGVKTPVIATIGDSTFFHGGIPGLINAVQHQVDLTLVIMDNRWTAMTGMQTNPGTPVALQGAGRAYRDVDIAAIIPALGVEHFFTIDPFDLDASTAILQLAFKQPGVKVVLSRGECAIPAARRVTDIGTIRVVAENCNQCKLCIMQTGCAAIELSESAVVIDEALCRVCGLCVEVCNRNALVQE